MKYTIATIGSHSSLQILKGARDEGFKTVLFTLRENAAFYGQYPFIDSLVTLEKYADLIKIEKKYKNLIIVPHGSFVAYLGADYDAKTSLKYFGNKKILAVEADRKSQEKWLKLSGVKTPKSYVSPDKVDRPVIVKGYGAMGGAGYRLCSGKKALRKTLSEFGNKKAHIQEYIVGTPVYVQFFYSPLSKKLELMGVDRRYESEIDGIGRIPAADQVELAVNPSFTVIGNFPIVLRESLLPKIYASAMSVIRSSTRFAPPAGLFGPFCLETVIDAQLNVFAVEISCRIVAGTNYFISGSPYSDLLYDKKVSTGRRIAMEIRHAIRDNKLKEILT